MVQNLSRSYISAIFVCFFLIDFVRKTSSLRVIHFATEPRRTPIWVNTFFPDALSSLFQNVDQILKLNSLPNDKMLDQSKMKAFAVNKIKLTQKSKLDLGWVKKKNIVGNGENAGYQHFLLYPQCLQNAFYTELLNIVTAR